MNYIYVIILNIIILKGVYTLIYNTKIIQSPNHIEIRRYKIPISTQHKNTGLKKTREKTNEINEKDIKKSIHRAREAVGKIVNANYDCNNNNSFLTLTFKEQIRDLDYSSKAWKLFKEKVERVYNIKLKYCGVTEYQDGTKEYMDKSGKKHKGTGRNSIHLHIVLFDVPYLDFDNLSKLWKKYSDGGSIHIKAINDIHNVAAYLCAHIGKGDDELFRENKGRKRYVRSEKLKKCTELKYNTNNLDDKYELEQIQSELDGVAPDYEFNSIVSENLTDKNGISRLCVIQKVSRKVYNFK